MDITELATPKEEAKENHGKPWFRVFAFHGGGLDTVMQLGIAHALLLAEGRIPSSPEHPRPVDMIAGLSAGAINGVALAEILQAGDELPDIEERLAAKVVRFLEFLEAYRNAPATVLRGFLPDPYETTFRQSLKCITLPRHFSEERMLRERSIIARTGFIKLLNDLLNVRVRVRFFARFSRLVLGWVASSEKPMVKRWIDRAVLLWHGWWLILKNLTVLPVPFGRMVAIAFSRGWSKIVAIVFARGWLKDTGVEAVKIMFATGTVTLMWATFFGAVGVAVLALGLVIGAVVIFPAAFLAWLLTTGYRLGDWVLHEEDWLPNGLGPIARALLVLGVAGACVRLLTVFKSVAGLLEAAAHGVRRGLGAAAHAGRASEGVIVDHWIIIVSAIILIATVEFWRWQKGREELFLRCINTSIRWFGKAFSRWIKARCRSMLDYYGILSDLGDSYALQEALVQLFDPDYFGKFRLDIGIDLALKHERAPARSRETNAGHQADPTREKKTLAEYAREDRRRPLEVAPLAANVATGRIEALPKCASVVDALMGACAVIPFYKAQKIEDPNSVPATKWFIDGMNVGNDPITEALDALRSDSRAVNRIAGANCGVRIYAVPLIPVEADRLPGDVATYTGLVQVGLRALQLQKFQDALLERRLVETYLAALPPDPVYKVRQPGGELKSFFRTEMIHLAPEMPLQLNYRIPSAENPDDRRALMNGAVAKGCRVLIERLLRAEERAPDNPGEVTALREAACRLHKQARVRGGDGHYYIPCRLLFPARDGRPGGLPGSDGAQEPRDDAQDPHFRDGGTGPGVPEVCRRCTIDAPGAKGPYTRLKNHVRLPPDLDAPQNPGMLAPLLNLRTQWAAYAKQHETPETQNADAAPRAPAAVAFVFSGGVFRGVFQVGFANAVSELNIKPDVIVGASVGTIMGGLVGRLLQEAETAKRRVQAQRLAATFLAIDQFVMTDRFADFVRRFSIRAAGARFSLRDADLTFRRYDRDETLKFTPRLRRVAAGIERLFYVSPFELRTFVEAARSQNYKGAWEQFKKFIQGWFDRYDVGLELLGPEPLELLINGYLFDDKPPPRAGFDRFAAGPRGFDLLGTATNLTDGQLDLLGTPKNPARLTEGMLASSAFPAVFRPRWSWEVFENPSKDAQYCDGGVMDNLPLDSVVEYLAHRRDADDPRFPRRPRYTFPGLAGETHAVPHLILAASLEPDPEDWTGFQPSKLKRRSESWMDLRRRASELAYNGKIDKFADAQIQIRRILNQRRDDEGLSLDGRHLPLDLDVAVVKARWLCSTFAFHPMLGFRRKDQAASIAHGCKSTFECMAQLFNPWRKENEKPEAFNERVEGSKPRQHWGREKGIPFHQLIQGSKPRDLDRKQQLKGVCWYRRAATGEAEPTCPFAKAVVLPDETAVTPAEKTRARELNKIYVACGQPATHSRRD